MRGKKLTAEEKDLVVQVHRHFKAERQAAGGGSDAALRERVAKCLGFGESTVAQVIAASNKSGGVPFVLAQPAAQTVRGSPIVENYGEDIRRSIRGRNLRGQPVSARHVKLDLKVSRGVTLSVRTLRHVIRRLGFRYIRGTTRYILAESSGVVVLRAAYLANKISHRRESRLPDLTEIFIDESYVNMNHPVEKAWQIGNGDRHTKSGRGNRVVMVGAGFVRYYKGRLAGGWVEGSFKAWRADTKPKKKKGVVVDPDDYHGNFTAPKFEPWFEKLCVTLKRKYGRCRIHMDGASYHKRRLNPQPTGSTNKPQIIAWLEEKEIPFPPGLTKASLLEIVKANKEAPLYATFQIATSHSHELLFTPPYHPELQPIEKIWGVIKNRIASDDPSQTMVGLLAKVNAEQKKVKPLHWTGAYEKVQLQEDEFLNASDDVVMADDASCSGSSSDSESGFSDDEQI